MLRQWHFIARRICWFEVTVLQSPILVGANENPGTMLSSLGVTCESRLSVSLSGVYSAAVAIESCSSSGVESCSSSGITRLLGDELIQSCVFAKHRPRDGVFEVVHGDAPLI
jgi:hypothetical protein